MSTPSILDEDKPRVTVDLTQMLAEVPSRLTRIEAFVETMREDIRELKTGQKDLRTELHGDFRFLLRLMIGMFATLGTLMLGLAGMVGHGFHWIL